MVSQILAGVVGPWGHWQINYGAAADGRYDFLYMVDTNFETISLVGNFSGEGAAAANAWYQGDFDGNGKQDLLKIGIGGSAIANVYLSNGNHTYTHYVSNLGSSGGGTKILPLDIDGDGKTDVIELWNNGGTTMATVRKSNGTAFISPTTSSIGGWGQGRRYLPLDVDSNGLVDIVEIYNDGGHAKATIWRSNGATFSMGASART